jgi:hypothetical protein
MMLIASDDLVRETVRQVLSRPEFSRTGEIPWFTALIRWFEEASGKFTAWAGNHPVLGWVVLVLLVVVLVALVLHLIYLAMGGALPWRTSGGEASPPPGTILEGEADSWQQGLAKAQEALAQGNLRLAVWITHRVLLGLLDENGSIRFARGKTNTEYLNECPRAHPRYETLSRLTQVYDRVVYGHRAVSAAAIAPLLGDVSTFYRSKPNAG